MVGFYLFIFLLEGGKSWSTSEVLSAKKLFFLSSLREREGERELFLHDEL